MRTIFIAIGIIILAIMARMAMMVVPASGMLSTLESTGLDQCRALDIAPGAEDFAIHHDTGRVFVSAAQRRPYHGNGFPHPDGDHSGNGIYSFLLDDPEGTLQLVSPDAPVGFSPHGIDLLAREDGQDRLFVVNHSLQGHHSIEIFDLSPDGILSWQESVRYPDLRAPNDVIAVGHRQFYATNDRMIMNSLGPIIEGYLGVPLSDVSYFDGENGRIAAAGFLYANGISQSPDGQTIYVAEVLGRRVSLFERAGADGTLRKIGQIPIHTAPDNITVSQDGTLWIGAHPRIFEFLAHAQDETLTAPSQVVRVDPGTQTVSTQLVSLNGELNASSAAAFSSNTLLVGAVLDSHILICDED